MTADQSYWEQLKPFQGDLLTPDQGSRQQRYLIQNSKNNDASKKQQEFDNTKPVSYTHLTLPTN